MKKSVVLAVVASLMLASCDSKRVESIPSQITGADVRFQEQADRSKEIDNKLSQVYKSADRFRDIYNKITLVLRPSSETVMQYTPIDLLIDLLEEAKKGFVEDTLVRRDVVRLNFLPDNSPCRFVNTALTLESSENNKRIDRLSFKIEKCGQPGSLIELIGAKWTNENNQVKIDLNNKILDSYFNDLKSKIKKDTGCKIDNVEGDVMSVACTNINTPISSSENARIENLNFYKNGDIAIYTNGVIQGLEGATKAIFSMQYFRNGQMPSVKIEKVK